MLQLLLLRSCFTIQSEIIILFELCFQGTSFINFLFVLQLFVITMLEEEKINEYIQASRAVTQKLQICEQLILQKARSKIAQNFQQEIQKFPLILDSFLKLLNETYENLTILRRQIPKFITIVEICEKSQIIKTEEIQTENKVSKRIEMLSNENEQLINLLKKQTTSYGRLDQIQRNSLKNEKIQLNTYSCSLCWHKCEELKSNQLGSLLKIFQSPSSKNKSIQTSLYAHEWCALWSPNFFVEKSEIFYGKFNDQQIKICAICKQSRAGLQCSSKNCKLVFHFPCFMNSTMGEVDAKRQRIFCNEHYQKQSNEEDIFEALLIKETQIRKKHRNNKQDNDINRLALWNEI